MTRILVLLLFLLPFQVALNVAADIDLALSRVLILGLFLLLVFSGLVRKKIEISQTLAGTLLLSVLFLAGISLFWAENMGWGLRKLAFFLSIFPAFWIFSNIKDRESVQKIVKGLVWGAFFVSVLSIVQFSLQFIWGLDEVYSFWARHVAPVFLGRAFAEAVISNPSWLVNISGKTFLRATATFPDPHMFSFYLNLAFFSCLGLLLSMKKGKAIYLAIIPVIFLADLLTFSRGGYLGLFSGFLLLVLVSWGRLGKRIRWGIAAVALGVILLLSIKSPVSQRFLSSFDFSEGSNVGRLEIWKDSLELISEEPWGVGLGNYPLAINPLAEYRDPIYAHNAFLDLASEIGIQGLFFWMLFLVVVMVSSFKKAKENKLFLGTFLGFAAFYVHCLVETPLYSPVVMITFLALAAISTVKYDEKAD